MSPSILFDRPAPRWFTIDAHRPFLTDLARTLFDTLGRDDPDALADAVVLLPTRRGARALAEAFVGAAGGRAVLLPQILALGDLDEGEPPFEPGDLALDLPPAITPLRRRFELARLVADHPDVFVRAGLASHEHGGMDAHAALGMADALAGFLDSAQIEEIVPPEDLSFLVESEHAKHWDISADVLKLATVEWPKRLAMLGLLDVNERRTRLLRALTAQWEASPPSRPLIAAGSTGSAPSTAALLCAIAKAPKGLVVLPGLDRELADSAWDEVGEDHPQGAMRRLLIGAGVERKAVSLWPSDETPAAKAAGRWRRRVVNEALRPAEATADWLAQIANLRSEDKTSGADPIEEGLKGLAHIPARNEEEAAAAIALLLREALETPSKTAALITPDAALARRVSARLARWGVQADASAGQPLSHSPVGVLLALLARTAADPLDPATTLAILKHPLVGMSRMPDDLQHAREVLERRGLRGPRPRDWTRLTRTLEDYVTSSERFDEDDPPTEEALREAEASRRAKVEPAILLARDLEAALKPLVAVFKDGAASAALSARTLAETLETLSIGADIPSGSPWSGQAGEAASALVAQMIDDGDALPPVTASGFSDLIEQLLASQTVRPGGPLHPRLSILGTIEARLVRADLVVLAGLEEGVWPRIPPTDPFFSREMRAKLGLPPPERRIGLAAHDFAQAVCAPEVVMVTTDRRDGSPTVRSRWLWRLETLARGAGLPVPRRDDVLAWAREIDAPLADPPPELRPAKQPEPRPPLEVRPTRMPVTRIETWVRDPYAVYARMILGLKAIDRPDVAMDGRARGSAIHRAFQDFANAHANGPLADAAAVFELMLLEALEKKGLSEPAMARERALARRLAGWAAAFEADRRAASPQLLIERSGKHAFTVEGRLFTVTAKADRIELANGLAHVLDFKTGAPPSKKQMETGFAPQLTLTAAILGREGFKDVGPVAPGDLAYVRVTGRRIPGEVLTPAAKLSSLDLAEAALEGLVRRVARFNDPDRPYRSWEAPQFLTDRGGGDFDHLARVYEWRVAGGGDGETGGGE